LCATSAPPRVVSHRSSHILLCLFLRPCHLPHYGSVGVCCWFLCREIASSNNVRICILLNIFSFASLEHLLSTPKPEACLFSSAAALNVVPLPATGSITTSPSSVNISISRLKTGIGFCVGCILGTELSFCHLNQLNIIFPSLLNLGSLSLYSTTACSVAPTIRIFAFNTCEL